MAKRNSFAKKVKSVLEQAFRERIPDKYPVWLEVITIARRGSSDYVDAVIVSDYFKRWIFPRRIDFVGKILDSHLPFDEAFRVTIIPFTLSEAERAGIATCLCRQDQKQAQKAKGVEGINLLPD